MLTRIVAFTSSLALVASGCTPSESSASNGESAPSPSWPGASLPDASPPPPASAPPPAAASPPALDGGSAGDASTAPESGHRLDLDDDGVDDSTLTVSRCPSPDGGTEACFSVRSTAFPALTSVPIDVPAGVVPLVIDIASIGRHFPGPIATIAVLFRDSKSQAPVSMHVVDPNANAVVARMTGPANVAAAGVYHGRLRGPERRKYPFLMGGFASVDSLSSNPGWVHVCRFDPGSRHATPPPESFCGRGFRAGSVLVRREELGDTQGIWGPHYIRFQGGVLDDLDGDGWDDITYPTSWVLKSISGRTLDTLKANAFNPSAQTEPNAQLAGFHDGRIYAGLTSFDDASRAKKRLLVAATNGVGMFNDPHCAVSRYIAMFESNARDPSSRRLAWSQYIGFSGSVYVLPPVSYQLVVRMENRTDKCPHRFGNALVEYGGGHAVAYSVFQAVPETLRLCYKEGYEVAFEQAAPQGLTACLDGTLKARGAWSLVVLDAATGHPQTIAPGTYAWGASRDVVRGQGQVLVVEPNVGSVVYDRTGHTTTRLALSTLNGRGGLVTHATCDVQAPPRIAYASTLEGPAGASHAGVSTLVLEDVDNDGLLDFQTADGHWYGASSGGCTRKR
jgi:hypothetical protein